MKKLGLLLISAILLVVLGCDSTKECCSEYKDCQSALKSCNKSLTEIQTEYKKLQDDWFILNSNNDSLLKENVLLDTAFKNLLHDYDSVKNNYNLLDISWNLLVHMFDSVVNIKPDTVIFIPQCTLCYKDTVNINGVQYYVGYDDKQYKLFQDEDTVIRQVFFKDTMITRFIIKDSIIDPPEKALIIIEAAGSECKDDWPILNVEVNGVPTRNIKVAKTYYNEYRFNVLHHEYNVDSIRISFGNDCYVEGVSDRNCYVTSVMINYHEYLLKENTDLSGYIWWHPEDPHTVVMSSNGSFLIETYKTNGQYKP